MSQKANGDDTTATTKSASMRILYGVQFVKGLGLAYEQA